MVGLDLHSLCVLKEFARGVGLSKGFFPFFTSKPRGQIHDPTIDDLFLMVLIQFSQVDSEKTFT